MKMGITIVTLAMAMALSAPAIAVELDGMYGVKFGQKLQTLKVVKELRDNFKNSDDTVIGAVIVPPESSVLPYDSYIVQVTPVSQRVYSVSSWLPYADKTKCKEDAVEKINYYAEKYDLMLLISNIASNDAYNILFQCRESDGGISMVSRFMDLGYMRLSAMEKSEIQSEGKP
jgi:hypothetical protein